MKALKNDYTKYVNEIGIAIQNCYADTVEPSNAELMRLYAFIGRSICVQGEKAFVVFLADLLEKQFPGCKGFSPRNLRRMRDYYRAFENDPDLLHKTETLGWTQNVVILESCESNEQRTFYIGLSLEQNLSKLALLKAIEAGTFEKTIHDAEEMQNTQAEAESENDIVTDGKIGLQETIRTVLRPLMTMCLTSRQGNFMPTNRPATWRIVEEDVLVLWISPQRVCCTSFINRNRSFMLRWNMVWMDRYRRWIAERFIVAVVIPDQNIMVWETVKASESDRSSGLVQNDSETYKFFGDLCVLTYHVFLIKLFCDILTDLESVEIPILERYMKLNDESSTHPKNRTGVQISYPSHKKLKCHSQEWHFNFLSLIVWRESNSKEHRAVRKP